MEFQNIKAVVTAPNSQKFHGYITRHKSIGADYYYQFTFDGGFETISLYKVADNWVYAGGMRVPNENWIRELGEQIDYALAMQNLDLTNNAMEVNDGLLP